MQQQKYKKVVTFNKEVLINFYTKSGQKVTIKAIKVCRK